MSRRQLICMRRRCWPKSIIWPTRILFGPLSRRFLTLRLFSEWKTSNIGSSVDWWSSSLSIRRSSPFQSYSGTPTSYGPICTYCKSTCDLVLACPKINYQSQSTGSPSDFVTVTPILWKNLDWENKTQTVSFGRRFWSLSTKLLCHWWVMSLTHGQFGGIWNLFSL